LSHPHALLLARRRRGVPQREHHGRRARHGERDRARAQEGNRRASRERRHSTALHERLLGRPQRDQAERDQPVRVSRVVREAGNRSGRDAADQLAELNTTPGFSFSAYSSSHDEVKRTTGFPSVSTARRDFDGSVIFATSSTSRSTQRAILYGSTLIVVSTSYSVSRRERSTSNCSSPTTARIGSDFKPSCSVSTCMTPSSSSCSSPFWNCF